jgi:hypothetical protein
MGASAWLHRCQHEGDTLPISASVALVPCARPSTSYALSACSHSAMVGAAARAEPECP